MTFADLADGDRFVQFVGGGDVYHVYRVTGRSGRSLCVYDDYMTDADAAAQKAEPGYEDGDDPRAGRFGYLTQHEDAADCRLTTITRGATYRAGNECHK